MNGLVWGAFLGGVAGMTKDILVTEYRAMQKERKEVARAKPHSFLYEVSDLETSFLCLYENCGQFEPARQKLNIAGKHLDKVAEVHARLRENAESNMSLAHVVASHNKELGTIALRESTRDMIRGNPDVNVNVVTSARKSIEENLNDLMKYIHTRSLVPKKVESKTKKVESKKRKRSTDAEGPEKKC